MRHGKKRDPIILIISMKTNMHENSYNKGNRPGDLTGNRRSDSRVNCVKWATGYNEVK